MWRLRRKRVLIPTIAVGVAFLLLVGMAIIGQFSTVPEDERIQVRPTSTDQVNGPDDPSPEESPLVFSLPNTDEPQELARATAEVVGSADTARFTEQNYVDAITPAAAPIDDGADSKTAEETAQTVVDTAWSQDPWEDRAKYKASDDFSPQTVRTVDEATFLDAAGAPADAREYMTSRGLTVMEVEGQLRREYTDPDSGDRLQQDMGTTYWTVAMLCKPEKPCKVFMALPGSLTQGDETDG